MVVIFFVVERLVVKTLQIEGVGKTVADCVAVPIHSGCDRTCRIQRADYVGEPFRAARAFSAALFGDFVAYAPHNHARMVSVAFYKCRKVFLRPLVK